MEDEHLRGEKAKAEASQAHHQVIVQQVLGQLSSENAKQQGSYFHAWRLEAHRVRMEYKRLSATELAAKEARMEASRRFKAVVKVLLLERDSEVMHIAWLSW